MPDQLKARLEIPAIKGSLQWGANLKHFHIPDLKENKDNKMNLAAAEH